MFIGWVNSENPIKPTQKLKKNGLGNWVGMVSKNEKPIKINEFRVKPDPNPKHLITQ